jgi:hypothetical protein
MLTAFWFKTSTGLGYGVTARDTSDAEMLLEELGYPSPGVSVIGVIEGIRHEQLDQNHVVPNSGPLLIRGVWFPRHNV